MHVLAALIYGLIVFLAVLAWGVSTGAPLLILLLVSPLLISGVAVALIVLTLVMAGVRWMWRCRGTLRLWRSPRRTSSGPRSPGAGPL